MNNLKLKRGDTIGVIAPSRPLWNILREVDLGLKRLKKEGFKIKKGKNISKHLFYSAGTVQERVDDLHAMFLDKTIKAIICATGGSSSIDLLDKIDYEIIKNNPKPFIGYSDITALLLSIEKNRKNIAIHGPNAYELSYLDEISFRQFINLLTNPGEEIELPSQMKVFKNGKKDGEIIGGNITLINGLLSSRFLPSFDGKILFWEEIGETPAMISFKLRELEISGKLKKLNGMVIGHLSDCVDKKYPKDNRDIRSIVLEIFLEYDFPIIQVDYFGHDIKNFCSFPLGKKCEINSEKKIFRIF